GYVRVSLTAVVVGLSLTAVIGWAASGLDRAGVADLRWAWVVGLLGFLPLVCIPFRAVLEAEQLGYRVNLVLTAQALLITITSLFVTQRLAVLMQGLLQGIGNATWAALADLHARHEHEASNQRLIELTKLGAVLAVAALAPIIAYNRRFVALWIPTVSYGGER